MESKPKKPSISCTVDTEQIKCDIADYARERGMKNASTLIRVAVYEHIRRRLPKKPVTVLHKRLRGIVG